MLPQSLSRVLAVNRTKFDGHQVRHATLIRRPRRPYTFTQLVTLSDGSAFTHRTTSPQPIYRTTKDTKNSALWNPSSQKLRNIEEDEAGRLKRFRRRFGRGFDVEAAASTEEDSISGDGEHEDNPEESLTALISSYSQEQKPEPKKSKSKNSGAQDSKDKSDDK